MVLRDGIGPELGFAVGRPVWYLPLMSLPVIVTSATFSVGNFLQEGRERDLLGALGSIRRRNSNQYRDHDEDHPEEQALEGRIQPWPPNRLAFKNITACEASVTRKSSATDSPTTHTILSALSTTRGRESRASRATFRSTRTSWSFFCRPPIPSGPNQSPGFRDLTVSGRLSLSAATVCSRRGHSIVSVPGDCPGWMSPVAEIARPWAANTTSPGIDSETWKEFANGSTAVPTRASTILVPPTDGLLTGQAQRSLAARVPRELEQTLDVTDAHELSGRHPFERHSCDPPGQRRMQVAERPGVQDQLEGLLRTSSSPVIWVSFLRRSNRADRLLQVANDPRPACAIAASRASTSVIAGE